MEVNNKVVSVKMVNVTIKSKNKNSIHDFILFFNKSKTRDLNVIKKYFQKNIKKKRLTILKSPHVNKKAQEQFESRLFEKQFTIQTTKILKYLIFLKRLNYNLFPDIDIKLKCVISNKKIEKLGLKIFNPNHFKINKLSNLKSNNLALNNLILLDKKNDASSKILLARKATRLLEVFDLCGEFLKIRLDSSVGRAKD